MAPIHNRMPVVLNESRLDEWMAPGNANSASLQPMLKLAPAN
jgi:putative SOS response-associated peptidase YedK